MEIPKLTRLPLRRDVSCSPLLRSSIIAFFVTILSNHVHAASLVQNIDADAGIGSSRAVVVDDVPLAHTTQLLPLDVKGARIGKGDAEKQIRQVLVNLSHALGKGGSDLDHVVKINVYAKSDEVIAAVKKVFAKKFKGHGPAVSFVVGNLAQPDALVAMDAIGVAPKSSSKDVLRQQAMMLPQNKSDAHVAVLPAGGAVYISGQAKEDADLAVATRKTLESLGATLDWLKLKKSDVVEFKAFLPMSNLGVVQKEFNDFFGSDLTPPISFVEWTQQKPQIEIELVAAAHNTDNETDAVDYLTPPGFTTSNVYCKVARINRGKKIYVSGLYAKPGTGEAQVKEIFAELGDVLKKSNSDFLHLVKATYYVSDNDASNMLNKLRPNYYDAKRPPAASKALVRGVGLPNRTLTLDMIAIEAEKK